VKLAFLIFAAFWVLAWIVLLVVGAVNVIFRPLLEDEVRDETDMG
jgi:hypothetical protein